MPSSWPLRWPNFSALAAFLTPAVASALAFVRAASALKSASLSRPCRSCLSTSQAFFYSLSFSQWHLYLAMASSNLRRSDMAFIARTRACKTISTEDEA